VTIGKHIFRNDYFHTKFANIDRIRATKIAFSLIPFARSLQIQTKRKKYSIAQLLTPAENNWLKSEIDSYLGILY
jgi:hypothetical protein